MSLNLSNTLPTTGLAGTQKSLPFPLGVNQTITTSGCCHHNTLSACRGWTPMLQTFTLGEQDLGHLYNTQTGVLDKFCWGSSHGNELQDSSFHWGLKTLRLCMHK